VTGGRIVGVGSSAAVPAGAEVIDFGDATLLPGFIDAHTHLTFAYSEDYNKQQLDNLRETMSDCGTRSPRATFQARECS
jgi:imidazolonepropionase-like amidohydrolase